MKIIITAILDDDAARAETDKVVFRIISDAKEGLWRELATYYGSSDVGAVTAEYEDSVDAEVVG